MDPEISGDPLDSDALLAATSDPDHVLTKLPGIRLGMANILPDPPHRASQIRCHLPVQQPHTIFAARRGAQTALAIAVDGWLV